MKNPIPAIFPQRELNWLKFNNRVLKESQDFSHPLLERIGFLGISASNLDEFFRVRVGELHITSENPKKFADPTAKQQLHAVHLSARRLMNRQYRFWENLLPELSAAGINLKSDSALTHEERRWLDSYFKKHLLPILTPLKENRFLFRKNFYLAVQLQYEKEKIKQILFLQIPAHLPRLIPLPTTSEKSAFFLLEELIKMHLSAFFPKTQILEAATFRLTRNEDFSIESTDHLSEELEKLIQCRQQGQILRLEVENTISKKLRKSLAATLVIDNSKIYPTKGFIDLTFLLALTECLNQPELCYPPLKPFQRIPLKSAPSLFKQIAQKDLLLHHPYDSFEPVIAFLTEAAKDPQVIAIKQTIYRIGTDPRLTNALIEAAKNGKKVTVFIEVRARLDEENNIRLAKHLMEEGCEVIFGLPDFKTHSKIILITRQEDHGIRHYLHLSTGNYNPKTAQVYTDIGLFTCNPEFSADGNAFFQFLSGKPTPPNWQKFMVAPFNLRQNLFQLIDQEIQAAKVGKPALIIAKMNSLFDQKIIAKLYEASQSGVKIELFVRGICALRPGIPGLSDNIRIRSLVGRFLEHSRICYFHNQGTPLYFLSSADWMRRNFDSRVEILFPILDSALKKRLSDILATLLADNSRTYFLDKNGRYSKRLFSPTRRFDSQKAFLEGKLRSGSELFDFVKL